MGKFLATTYKDTVDGITSFYNDLVNNPFYTFNDKKPVFVTYYNINKDYTSLDPGSKLAYDNVGGDTPLRFNVIKNFCMYGIDRIELNTEIGEFGLEANPIEGDCYILPNTIVPTEGDYFELSHVKDSTWLFIVKDVQKDTLDNGANAYKISYKLEYDDNSKIQENIVKSYEMIEKREGTNVVMICEEDNVKIARQMSEIATTLKDYFNDIFYNKYVQTFIYEYETGFRVYDPFMIEFLIRNKILDNGDDSFVYVNHVVNPSKTFHIDYDHCIMRAFEKKDHDKINSYMNTAVYDHIVSYGTTFASRYESYFKAVYSGERPDVGMMSLVDDDICNHIQSHMLYEDLIEPNVPSNQWKNLLVKHFYGDKFEQKELLAIEQIKFEYDISYFYIIPLLIYILEERIQDILK